MNKKKITIDTDFFDDGIEAKLREYPKQEIDSFDERKASSLAQVEGKSSSNYSVHSYGYEYAPDNQQIPENEYAPDNECASQNQYDQRYEYQQMPEQNIRKLQAANQFENIISRAMANLFVRCWEQMKALLPQYSGLVLDDKEVQETQQILQDYNNVFYSHLQVENQNQESHQSNVFSDRAKTTEIKKREILQRQKRGITLDSLEKHKLSRSKSISKVQSQKIVSQLNIEEQSKETIPDAQKYQKQESKPASRKSYREKFIEYKHRSKSKDANIFKSQVYAKYIKDISKEKIRENSHYDRIGHYDTRNLGQKHNPMGRKNHIFRNINQHLMDREDIYSGQAHNYYINHRGSSRNIFQTSQNHSLNHPHSYFSEAASKVPYNASNPVFSHTNPQEELVRARLIEQIVEKLNYSKLRIQDKDKEKPKNSDEQIIQKINRLQKVILELRTETQVQNKNNQIKQTSSKHQILYANQTENQNLYRKFLDEISSLRSQIRLIKSLQQIQPSPQIQPQNTVIVDNSSNHIINEQQKLLNSYQHQFGKIISERQRVFHLQENYIPKVESTQKTFYDQLTQNEKFSQKRIEWSDEWKIKQGEIKSRSQQQIYQNNQSKQTLDKSRKTQHSSKDEGLQKYRYTRTQILEHIGFKDQIKDQQRLWRQNQARLQLDRQRREKEFRIMTEKVKMQRSQDITAQNTKKNKPNRQKYEQQWQRYQNTQFDISQSSNPFCALFPC